MLKEWLNIQNNTLDAFEFDGYPVHDYSIKNRNFWSAFSDERKQSIIKNAETYINYSIPEIKATYYLEYRRSGNRAIMENASFARRTALCCLVLGECIENSGRFTDDIINVLVAICEESFWGISAHSTPLIPDMEKPVIDLFAADTAATIAWVMLFIGELLDEVIPELRVRIDYEMERRIKNPFMTRDYWWTGSDGREVNNWNPWIVSNIISVYLFFEKDESKKRAGLVRSLEYLDNFINSYPEDGGCDEGTSYWGVAGGAMYDALEQIYIASHGKISFFDEPLILKMVEYMRHLHIYKKNFVNYADASVRPSPPGALIYRWGKLINDNGIQSFGAFLFNSSSLDGRPQSLRGYFMNIMCENEIKNCKAPYNYEIDSCLPNLQVVTARESDTGNRGFFLSVKGGHNNESHNHNDIGNYIVYLNGTPAVIDAGVGVYTKFTFSSERYKIWTMRSDWHNLPSISANGTEYVQLPGKNRRTENFSYTNTPEVVTVSCDIESAYDVETSLSKLNRKTELHRLNNESSYISVCDSFDFAKAPDSITENIILTAEPDIYEDHADIMLDENSGIRIHYINKSIEAEKEDVDISTDNRLRSTWNQNQLWRLKLTLKNADPHTIFSYKITPISR